MFYTNFYTMAQNKYIYIYTISQWHVNMIRKIRKEKKATLQIILGRQIFAIYFDRNGSRKKTCCKENHFFSKAKFKEILIFKSCRTIDSKVFNIQFFLSTMKKFIIQQQK